MATTFGTRPEDTSADSRGNVNRGVVIQLYPSKADAEARTNLIASPVTNALGLFPYDDPEGRYTLWARDPDGRVWAIESEGATPGDFTDAVNAAQAAAEQAASKAATAASDALAGVQAQVDASAASAAASAASAASAAATASAPAAAAIDARLGGDSSGILDPASPDTKRVLTVATADAAYGAADGRVVCKGNTRAAVIAALDAAEAKGKGTIVYFPSGVYDVGNGLSLAGYSCQIQGAGAAGRSADAVSGTVFRASTQTGPVLDFTDWVIPGPSNVFEAKVRHGGFHVQGSGAADASKNNSGVRLKTMSSATFHDIAVMDTGGPAWEHISSPGNAVYLCDFERITLNTPISAKANDVPYLAMNESNGNNFRSIGFRSMLASADCGVSGALVISGNTQYVAYGNKFDGCWMENLHVPNGGTLVNHVGNADTFDGFVFHDCFKEAAATGTSHVRFASSSVTDFGGNTWSGVVPGHGDSASEIDYGIDVRQSRNSIVGIKGYRGANVLIAPGVTNTSVRLGGAVSSAVDPAATDNSGNATNVIVDDYLQTATNAPGIPGAWKAYSPVLTGAGWAVGNGTITGSYVVIGKTVHYSARITWGSTSTYGSASPSISLPLARVTAYNAFPITAAASKTGVGDWMLYGMYNGAATVGVFTISTGGSTGYMTGTAPFTIAAGNTLYVSGTYETP